MKNLLALVLATAAQAEEDPALYADLQQARDAEALKNLQEAKKAPVEPENAAAMMPARYEVERGDWKTAMDLPVAKSKYAPQVAGYFRARAR